MALGSDELVSQRCGYLSQISWYAFLFIISLCFLKLTMVCSCSPGSPVSLGIQPQPRRVTPLLSLVDPEMGLCSRGPAYAASCSSGTKGLGLQS